MQQYCLDRKFSVYIHTSPNGKHYVGITSKKPEQRWGYNGNRYANNKHFYAAIKLYGWDNFEHEIVATDLDINEASELESSLIAKYNCMNPEFGYNQTTGGNWSSPSDEVRERLRVSTSLRWKDQNYRNWMCEIQKNLPHKPLSEEHKQRIKDYWKTHVNPMKGKKISPEQSKHLSEIRKGREPWNKGITKDSNESVLKISESLKGRKFSDDTKKLMSESRRNLYASGYSPIWVNNGIVERQILDNSDIPDGFVVGRIHLIYITDGITTKKIPPDEFSEYEKLGWVRGKAKSISENIHKARQMFIWLYDGKEFSSSSELASYLNNNGYPEITDSTITSLYKKGFSKSKKYGSLDGKIFRKNLNES